MFDAYYRHKIGNMTISNMFWFVVIKNKHLEKLQAVNAARSALST